MSLKLSIFKVLGAATLAGVSAVAAQKSAQKPRKKGGCTPCATAAAMHKARAAARTGSL